MAVVVVESPAKAKTITKYLGPGFTVLASYGHVRDLPAKDGSVDPNADFAMEWEVDAKSQKHVKAIADAIRGDDRLILATDPDREGEAISWHLLETLRARKAVKAGTKVERVVFNAITKSAVTAAMTSPREIDRPLVDAYLARRALDYLVGFTLSPVLWRRLPGARSAGRVQSVALRLVVERELEIAKFRSREHWSVSAEMATPRGDVFRARLVTLDGGKLDKFSLADKAAADRAVAEASARRYTIGSVEARPEKRHPAAPFTTSTLQQEASRKLGLSPAQTMRIAQRLYEGVEIGGETVGLITYMRTDGVDMAPEAVMSARDVVRDRYGEAYLPSSPRMYKSKQKNAQEAHECIRPTDMRRAPERLGGLEPEMRRLYELIWTRSIACQMESARLERTTVDIPSTDGGRVAFRATGQVVVFDGFLKLYQESRDDRAIEGRAVEREKGAEARSEDEDAEASGRLPKMAQGEALDRRGVAAEQHFTQPPPRFSEAALVKRMEELGIGRPSTYASILSVIQERGYAKKDKGRLVPEDKGLLVTAFLESYFLRYVEYGFTADLEDSLDEVSGGRKDWRAVLRAFWDPFHTVTDEAMKLRTAEVIDRINDALEPHIFPERADGAPPRQCPSCGGGRLSLKPGKFGAFIGCSSYPDCRYTRQLGGDETAPDAAGEGRLLGEDPATGLPVLLRSGRFGYYVQLGEAPEPAPAAKGKGKTKSAETKSAEAKAAAEAEKPKRASLPKGVTAETITLEAALKLLALPREVGRHPEDGEPIIANIGRFGPFLKHGATYANLKDAAEVFEVGLNRAVVLLAEKKERGPGAGRRGSAKPERVLGAHPADGAPVELFAGRYGPYVKHGSVNATLAKGATAESVTLEAAVALLAAKGPAGKSAKPKKAAAKPASKAAPKAAATKKAATATSKAAAKKPAARRAAAPAAEDDDLIDYGT